MLPGGDDNKSRLKKKCCIKSKAAIAILMWNFAVLLIYNTIGNISNGSYSIEASIFTVTAVGTVAVLAPMAGLLTDVKYSRYKVVVSSSYCLLFEVIAMLIVITVVSILKETMIKKNSIMR